MTTGAHLCVTVRFLQPTFHGRADGGSAEWPPSPLRLFQALVASAARLQPAGFDDATREAFRWLEESGAPMIVATSAHETTGMRLSVPNNAMDIVARAWSRGSDLEKGDADPRTHRTMKTVRPYWLRGDRVRYIWSSNADSLRTEAADRIVRVARHLTCLGWGIDQVIGNASIAGAVDPPSAHEEEWHPSSDTSQNGLRAPMRGTFEDLVEHHRAFVNRIGPDGFSAPPPVSAYEVFEYRRASDPATRSVAVFSVLRPDGTAFRAFDAARRALTVAGMVRHTAKEAATASGWASEKVAGFVLGHAVGAGSAHVPVGVERFAYLPLPSIESRGGGRRLVGSIRRVAITGFSEGLEPEIAWARRAMSGRDLFDEDTGEAVAQLVLLPGEDHATQSYLLPASTWSTVTPVVLPGFDDPEHLRRKASSATAADQRKRFLERISERTDRLIRRAIRQFGLSELLVQHADIEWRKIGFLPGVGHADRYGVPDHLRKFPRYHVRLSFHDGTGRPVSVPGPLCIGGGRYAGVGLCVGCDGGAFDA